MKVLLTLCFASFASFISLAQSQPTMVSQSRYFIDGNGTPVLADSLTHSHSSGRVSYGLPIAKENKPYSPHDGVYMADESIRVYKSAMSADLVDKMIRTFNSDGLISEYREFRKPISVYQQVYKEWYDYNADKQLETQWATNNQELRRLKFIYQNGFCIAKRYELETVAPGQVWDLYAVDSFKSNGTDSSVIRYGANMQPFERHYYLRDANYRIVVDSYYSAVVLQSVTKTSYDAAGRKLTDSIFAGSSGSYTRSIDYTYDNNGNMVSRYYHGAPNTFDTMTYNVINQLTSVETFIRINNAWVAAPGLPRRYYYYGFPTGVDEIASNEPLRLYPVPATSYINIDMSFDKPEKFAVRIYNMQGQLVRQWEEAAHARYSKRIQLDGMPAGDYIVQVASENQNITRQFNVLQ